MKVENPQYRNQVKVVRGDCLLPGVGIDEIDVIRMASTANVVIHLAATSKSDNGPTLQEAVRTNVRATRDLIILAKRFRNLKVPETRRAAIDFLVSAGKFVLKTGLLHVKEKYLYLLLLNRIQRSSNEVPGPTEKGKKFRKKHL